MTGRGGWVDPYEGMPGRRIFIAVPLPAKAVEAVAGVVDSVRAMPLPDGSRDVRWVRLDGLHLTLRFLGPTPEDRVGQTSAAMESVAARTLPSMGELAGSGAFPPTGRPRTIWIGVVEGAAALGEVSRDLAAALDSVGWPPDARPFRAHLTLARSDGIAAGSLVADRLAAAFAGQIIPFRIERLVLYESVTGGGPARYVPVSEAPLGGQR
ncbi:MAG: RNA 2',3'-cyclic phosphodiesterase [Candidatus Limnocylindrales bacterium]